MITLSALERDEHAYTTPVMATEKINISGEGEIPFGTKGHLVAWGEGSLSPYVFIIFEGRRFGWVYPSCLAAIQDA
jgi:hypothetical protein